MEVSSGIFIHLLQRRAAGSIPAIGLIVVFCATAPG
jgi:hypothetical protein